MANEEQLRRLKQNVEAWNAWRQEDEWKTRIDLSEADLTLANLRNADLRGDNTNLTKADLRWAHLAGANLRETTLIEADLRWARLDREADLRGADLAGATLRGATLRGAYLSGADLHGANLSGAILNEAELDNADLTGCRIYGVSAWGLKLSASMKQQGLIITPENEPEITTDNLEVAQFIYLLLHNEKIRDVIDTIGKKAVLILGRFTPERKAVLDALRDELRRLDYLPILFDFDKPASRDLTATVSTLAHLARFIIADLTDPSSIPHELATVVPHTPVPVQPILLSGKTEFSMFADLRRRHDWVLATYHYDNQAQLIADLRERVVLPAEEKALELQKRR